LLSSVRFCALVSVLVLLTPACGAVAELALMVNQHKEKNLPAPANLALGVKGVGLASDTLNRVALALAADEYDDYPIIQEGGRERLAVVHKNEC
jgi:hypothetical protein